MRYRSFHGKMMPKTATLLVSLTCFTLQGTARQMNSPQQRFKITLEAEGSEVKSGSNVCVDVGLTNTSSHDLLVSTAVSSQTLQFDYEVRFQGRDLVPQKPLPGPFVGSVEGGMFKPNDTYNVYECLNKRYDITKPGKYTIQAVRGVWTNAKHKKVRLFKSNIITVTVVP